MFMNIFNIYVNALFNLKQLLNDSSEPYIIDKLALFNFEQLMKACTHCQLPIAVCYNSFQFEPLYHTYRKYKNPHSEFWCKNVRNN